MKLLGRIGVASTGIAGFLAMNAQGQNLLVNGDFENSAGFTPNPITSSTVNDGWATFGLASQSSAEAESGNYSLLVQNVSGNDYDPQGAYEIINDIAPGLQYILSTYFLTDTGTTYGTPVDIQLNFGYFSTPNTFTVLGTSNWGFGSPTSTSGSIPTEDTWYQGTVSGTAPVGTVDAEVYLFFMDDAQTTTENVYFDNATLEAVPEPSTLAVLGLGLAVPALFRRRKY